MKDIHTSRGTSAHSYKENGSSRLSAEDKLIKEKSQRSLLWLGIVSIIMLFAGLTSGYVVIQADYFWVKFALPKMFYVSSAIILISSVTMNMAVSAARKNKANGVKNALIITFLLGFGFIATQYMAWSSMVKEGNFFVGKISALKGEYGKDYVIMLKGRELVSIDGTFYNEGDKDRQQPLNEKINKSFNTASGFLYVLSGLHLVHLLAGMIYLGVVTKRSFNKRYTSNNVHELQLCSIYWHFLDGLWIYLFLFLNFIR